MSRKSRSPSSFVQMSLANRQDWAGIARYDITEAGCAAGSSALVDSAGRTTVTIPHPQFAMKAMRRQVPAGRRISEVCGGVG